MSNLTPERLAHLRNLYRGRRTISPPAGRKGWCCWCDVNEVGRGRRTWCGDVCVQEYQLWANPVQAAWTKDKGVCQECGLDAETLWQRYKISVYSEQGIELREQAEQQARALGLDLSTCFWEADHIQELAEGGCNDPANIRTLCQRCHRSATARFRRRRAEHDKKTITDSGFGALRLDARVWVMFQGGDRREGSVVKLTRTTIRVKWKSYQDRWVSGQFRRTDGTSPGKRWSWLKLID